MSARAEQKARSHETILSCAARLVRERGIGGAKVADVMDAAGLTVGGFYAHFPSKESLVDAAIRRTGAEMRERLFGRLEDKPAADRAEIVLKRYLSAAHRDNADVGCPLPAVVGEIASTQAAHRDVLEEQLATMADELQAQLPGAGGRSAQSAQSAQSGKGSAAALSPRTLSLGLLALMVGGLGLSRALRGTELSDEIIRACRALGAFAARGGEAGPTKSTPAPKEPGKTRRSS
jgi:TetR/AcrR family transcriptional repressor of nem operon